jgi:hypothetical protein
MAVAAEELPVVSRGVANKALSSRIATEEHSKRQARSVRAAGAKQRQRVKASKEISRDKAALRASTEQEREQRREAKAANKAAGNFQLKQAEQERKDAYAQADRRNKRLSSAGKAIYNAHADRHDVVNVPSAAGPVINPLLLILFTWAGILLLYVLITSPAGTAGFLESMRGWISLIYSSSPMFSSVPVQPITKNVRQLPSTTGAS